MALDALMGYDSPAEEDADSEISDGHSVSSTQDLASLITLLQGARDNIRAAIQHRMNKPENDRLPDILYWKGIQYEMNEAAKAIGIAAMSGRRLPVPPFFREIWPLLEQRSMKSIEQLVNNDVGDAMDCRPDPSNQGWWLNTRAASDLPRSYADNIRARNILIERLRRIRDATETVADNTRGQISKYGEEMLEVVQVIEAFRTAVHKKPSPDPADSPPAPSDEYPQGGDSTQSAPAGESGGNPISPPQMPIPSTSALPQDFIDLTD